MANVPSEEVRFNEADLAPVEATMASVASDGSGWINFLPALDDGTRVPPRSTLFAIFTARGPAVPMATWKPGSETPATRPVFGIEHGSGPQALARLREHDLALPAGWLKVADHPKRGLVLTAPAGTADGEILWWLLTACHILSTVPLSGDWLARVYG